MTINWVLLFDLLDQRGDDFIDCEGYVSSSKDEKAVRNHSSWIKQVFDMTYLGSQRASQDQDYQKDAHTAPRSIFS